MKKKNDAKVASDAKAASEAQLTSGTSTSILPTKVHHPP